MNKSIWVSGRGCIFDRFFGHEPTVAELRKKGMNGTTFSKKNKFYPKHTKAHEMEDEMQEKEVGTVRDSKGASINGSITNDLHLVALVDNKHDSLILNSWSTTIINGDTKKIRVVSELGGFKHGLEQTNYYYDRHVVDDNNNTQDFLPFEEVFMPNDWNKWHL